MWKSEAKCDEVLNLEFFMNIRFIILRGYNIRGKKFKFHQVLEARISSCNHCTEMFGVLQWEMVCCQLKHCKTGEITSRFYIFQFDLYLFQFWWKVHSGLCIPTHLCFVNLCFSLEILTADIHPFLSLVSGNHKCITPSLGPLLSHFHTIHIHLSIPSGWPLSKRFLPPEL
jgi:hypothetical protein